MPTSVVERIELPFAVFGDDVFVARDFELDPVTWIGKSYLVGDQHPLFAENGPSFQLIYLTRSVPAGWQSSNRLFDAVCVRTRAHGTVSSGSGCHIGIEGVD